VSKRDGQQLPNELVRIEYKASASKPVIFHLGHQSSLTEEEPQNLLYQWQPSDSDVGVL
jgi:hypothetical protein